MLNILELIMEIVPNYPTETTYDDVHLPEVDIILPQLLNQIFCVAVYILVGRPMPLLTKHDRQIMTVGVSANICTIRYPSTGTTG
jgi:hypothetical protein